MSEAKDIRPSANHSPKEHDPTEEPEFQKVVGYFLRTPAKPRKEEQPKAREKKENDSSDVSGHPPEHVGEHNKPANAGSEPRRGRRVHK